MRELTSVFILACSMLSIADSIGFTVRFFKENKPLIIPTFTSSNWILCKLPAF